MPRLALWLIPDFGYVSMSPRHHEAVASRLVQASGGEYSRYVHLLHDSSQSRSVGCQRRCDFRRLGPGSGCRRSADRALLREVVETSGVPARSGWRLTREASSAPGTRPRTRKGCCAASGAPLSKRVRRLANARSFLILRTLVLRDEQLGTVLLQPWSGCRLRHPRDFLPPGCEVSFAVESCCVASRAAISPLRRSRLGRAAVVDAR